MKRKKSQTIFLVGVFATLLFFEPTSTSAQGGSGRVIPSSPAKPSNPGSRSRTGGGNRSATESPRDAAASKHYESGLKLCEAKNYAEGEAELRLAIEFRPDDSTFYVALANCLADQKKFSQAEAEHRKAVRLDPEAYHLHERLGYVLLLQQKYPEAESEYRVALRTYRPDPNSNTNAMTTASINKHLGISLYYQNNNSEAQSIFEKCVSQASSDPSAVYIGLPADCRFWLARAFRSQNKLQEAENEYRLSLHLNPQNSMAKEELNEVLRLQGKKP